MSVEQLNSLQEELKLLQAQLMSLTEQQVNPTPRPTTSRRKMLGKLGIATAGAVMSGVALSQMTKPAQAALESNQIVILDTPVRCSTIPGSTFTMSVLYGNGQEPQVANSNSAIIKVNPKGGSGNPFSDLNGRVPKAAFGLITSVGTTLNGNLRVWKGGSTPNTININLPFSSDGTQVRVPNLSTGFVTAITNPGYYPGAPDYSLPYFYIGYQGVGQAGFALDITGFYL